MNTQKMLGQYAEEWKFSFNTSKSKTMVVGATSGCERWRISGEKMEEVKAFKYLGCGLIGHVRECAAGEDERGMGREDRVDE